MKMGEIDGVLPLTRRVAVVGGGISGLATAWLLSRHPERFTVTLFEASHYVGGHTNTVDVTLDGISHPVDTGFLVFNRRTYPNLCALFALLGVESVASEMSFGVSLSQPDIEWAGSDLGTVFAQGSNLFRPAMWGMLADIMRFNRETTRLASTGRAPELSLGEFLDKGRYGEPFRNWYLLPMAAAIWSCPTRTMLEYPLATFVRFCHNHGLLQVLNRPQWLTVKGGGRSYVRRMLADLDDVRVRTPVEGLHRRGGKVSIRTGGEEQLFDDVVLACHSDQALSILGESASGNERSVLSAVSYQPNRAVLHTDAALLPRREKVWSAWNYMSSASAASGADSVSVSYLINRLQPLPWKTPVVVSLNPHIEPDPSKVIADFDYAHPVFDQAAILAQARLGNIQGRAGVWFAGAWSGFGFHEDGLRSALGVVEAMGASVPWRGDGGAAAESRVSERVSA